MLEITVLSIMGIMIAMPVTAGIVGHIQNMLNGENVRATAFDR